MMDKRVFATSFLLAAVGALAFITAGPESNALTRPLERIVFYGALALMTAPLGHCLAAALLYLLRSSRPSSLVPAVIGGSLYHGANLATAAYGLYMVMAPDGSPPGWPVFFLRGALASMIYLSLINYIAVQRARISASGHGTDASHPTVERDDAGTSPIQEAAPLSPPARLLSRLPAQVGRDVIFLRMNGHYINVVTAIGSAAILMRFADAVAELDSIGMQVHRSFWVAYRHIAEVTKRADRTVVRMSNGEEIPVSRTFQPAVRELDARRQNSGVSPGHTHQRAERGSPERVA